MLLVIRVIQKLTQGKVRSARGFKSMRQVIVSTMPVLSQNHADSLQFRRASVLLPMKVILVYKDLIHLTL